jgi:hypothetical protein
LLTPGQRKPHPAVFASPSPQQFSQRPLNKLQVKLPVAIKRFPNSESAVSPDNALAFLNVDRFVLRKRYNKLMPN